VDRVAVVGAGPIGLTAALELASLGVPTTVLEAKPALEPIGSRAIVLAHDALATFRRLGCDEIPRKGVRLSRARTYLGETELFTIDFPPVPEDELPAFVNLQQTYTEQALFRRAEESGLIDLRFDSAVIGLRQDTNSVTLELDGGAEVDAAYAIAADGAHSTVRKLIGVDFPGKSFNDRFLIADVRRTAYRFHSRLASRFRVGRVFLAGDAAHLMAPFGARGMNSGVEDATSLASALASHSPDAYERERRAAAIENLRITGATMRFMAPSTPFHRLWRNAVLRGSLRVPQLRRFVNSGKLPTPR
jgi:2-polyprenyl-6-methoxyphenol hydroxylase-like FAD-dependent oxidoreductase